MSLCEPQSVSRKVTELMESHPLYSLAEKLVLEHIMVAFKPSSQTVWLITTMICIISSEMWEIYRLICILSHYQSDFTMTVTSIFIFKYFNSFNFALIIGG